MTTTNIQSNYQYWKGFDLLELQKELDTTANGLACRQDNSDISRKRLVEQSRDFKKNTPEDIRKVVAPLLKSFQLEIDALTKRSTAAETVFLTLYRKLIDLPDPTAALEQAVQIQKRAHHAQDLEIENKQLRETLDEYNHEFAEVKNQEVTIKQLREKVKDYEERLEASASAKAKEKERELQKTFAEKERQLQESQLSMAKKLGEAEHKTAALQSGVDAAQSELFDYKSKLDETSLARSDELEMVMSDLERANERAAAAEKESDALKLQLQLASEQDCKEDQHQTSADMEQAIDLLKRSSLEVELATKEKEVGQLVEDVQRLQSLMNKIREESSNHISKLDDELMHKTTAFEELEQRMKMQEDYDEIKRELEILKSVEFSSSDESAGLQTGGKLLEVLLLEKNKQLQNEITKVKSANSEMSMNYEKLQHQHADLSNTTNDQKQLIIQLEDDLRSVNAVSSLFRGEGEGEASSGRQSVDIVAEVMKDSTVALGSTQADESAASSLLPIIQSQRERFRQRAQELEAQVIAGQQHVQMLQNEMDKLRSDNVKLYEKVRFLQSYSAKGRTVSANVEDPTVNRYSSQYEEKLNPFSSFNRKERMRKYANLKPYDKITLSMGRFIMGNRVARTVTFFYTLVLHMLVFLVLYKVAHTEDCKREVAAELCHDKFAEHMAKVHGDGHWDRVHKP